MTERRHVRRRDGLELGATLFAIVVMALGGLYLHGLQRRLDQHQAKLTAQQQRLNAQQQRLGQLEVRSISQAKTLRSQQVALGDQYVLLVESCYRLQIVRVQVNIAAYALWQLGLSLGAQAQLRQLSWTPITDCRRAVNRYGVRYPAPRSVPFVQRLPPTSVLQRPK